MSALRPGCSFSNIGALAGCLGALSGHLALLETFWGVSWGRHGTLLGTLSPEAPFPRGPGRPEASGRGARRRKCRRQLDDKKKISLPPFSFSSLSSSSSSSLSSCSSLSLFTSFLLLLFLVPPFPANPSPSSFSVLLRSLLLGGSLRGLARASVVFESMPNLLRNRGKSITGRRRGRHAKCAPTASRRDKKSLTDRRRNRRAKYAPTTSRIRPNLFNECNPPKASTEMSPARQTVCFQSRSARASWKIPA